MHLACCIWLAVGNPPETSPQSHTRVRAPWRSAGIPLRERFPALRAWLDRFKAREAVQRGLNVPDRSDILSHSEKWEGLLRKAGERLAGLRAMAPEE